MRWPWQQETKTGEFMDVLRRLIASQQGVVGGVTPNTCMKSPTVHAIVTAVSRRLAVTPIHIFEKTESNGKVTKKRLPSHPVANLLRAPNKWQSPYDFWQDATSCLMRWGRFHAFKSRGATGPIRELLPLDPSGVKADQNPKTWQIVYRVNQGGDSKREYAPTQLFNVRGPARDFVQGDSPVEDVNVAISLEILAERFGANFFQNGALPLMIFGFMEGSAGFETREQEEQFLSDLKDAFGGDKMLTSMLLPKGMEKKGDVQLDLQSLQMVEARRYQRTVIAGAWGVPPHLVGDLERGTFNNVEQQDKDFTQNVVMPVAKAFEAAIERDLFTTQDRLANRVARFNLDSTLRADFKSRQEGLQIQRSNGIINADEWREIEGKNPRADEHGEDYLHPGNMVVDGEEANDAEPDGPPRDQDDRDEGV